MKPSARYVHLKGAIGTIRQAKFGDKDRVVVPIVALVEGVIFPHGAKFPELVTAQTFSVAPGGWNGRPVFFGHPTIDGKPVPGNSPTILERSIGTVFNANVNAKQLQMEAWLDPEREETKKILEKIEAHEIPEVSVGALVVAESRRGQYDGKEYGAAWTQIIPDHLAILENEKGACSVDMGCGIRAAAHHEITEAGITWDSPETVSVKFGIWQRLTNFFRAANHEDDDLGMSDSDVRRAIQDTLSNTCPGAYLEQVYDDYIIYCEPDPETGAPKYIQRSYVIGENGVVGLGDDKTCVEPVLEYRPTESNYEAAAGARHSASDMAIVQKIHDHAVELGAACTGTRHAERACACSTSKEGENMKTKVERIKALIENPKSPFGKADEKFLESATDEQLARFEAAADGGLIDAIIAQIADKLGLSDAAKADLSNLSEETLAELAGISMPSADGSGGSGKQGNPPDPNAQPKAAAAQVQLPADVQKIVDNFRAAEKTKRDDLVAKLVVAQKEFTKEELEAMPIEQLERYAKVLVKPARPVDFSGQAPHGDGNNDKTPPAAIDMNARIRTARHGQAANA